MFHCRLHPGEAIHAELTEKVRIGIVGGMPDIIEAQVKAGKVITL